MKLPFDLPAGHLPVIVPRPKVRPQELVDGTVVYEAHNIRFLNLEADRGLYDIGFMLDVRQFATLLAAEQFTILALQRKLTFSKKIVFPNLRDTGELIFVETSDNKSVWATIPESVIVTSKFTVLDLHDQGMALDELDVIRERIERSVQGCPSADKELILDRITSFKTPHPTDIRRALKSLISLGIVRDEIQVGRGVRRAVFNMRMVAATKSRILNGMIKADDQLRRVDGTKIEFGVDLADAAPPATRIKATSSGRKRNITRPQYQSMYHKGRADQIKAEKRLSDYERDGNLTPGQFAALRKALDNPNIPTELQEELKRQFTSAHSDPLTEIPETDVTERGAHAKSS